MAEHRRPHPLAALGPTQNWQSALLLPERYLDLSQPARCLDDFVDDARRPIRLQVTSTPTTRWPNNGSRARRPWIVFGVTTPAGEDLNATWFGDTRNERDSLVPGAELVCLASVQRYADRTSLLVQQRLDPAWVGMVRPCYPGKTNVITAEEVRNIVQAQLPHAIPAAANWLEQQIASLGPVDALLRDLGADGWSLQALLEQGHTPTSLAHAELSVRVLRRLAALSALQRMPGRRSGHIAPRVLSTLDARIAQLPWPLTDDQARALADIRARLATGQPLAHVLSGEVGSGKTAIFLLLAVAFADEDNAGRTVLLAPNAQLAAQHHADYMACFPDRPAALVTAEADVRDRYAERVLIGTSALLHRPIDPPDLLVVDEQHRFSRAQREQLLGPHTHLLEMTATPIPRSQALLQFGGMSFSQMRQTHAPKTFHTRLYEGGRGMQELFAQLDPALRSGDPLLVVYPRREAGEGDAPEPGTLDRYAVDRAFARWNERYPGRVAYLTANDDDATKQRVLEEFSSGRTPILIGTSIFEMGLNLSVLYRIVIVCPERYGLVTLHQFRGRVARQGGEGYCELLCPEPISPASRARLQTFMSTTDGFALAEMDLRARGAGDLGADSSRQSGAETTLFFGVKINAELLEEAVPVWERWAKTNG